MTRLSQRSHHTQPTEPAQAGQTVPAESASTEGNHAILCRLDELLSERSMTLTELSERVGVSLVNLSVLKNGRARAIRFSTLTAICRALDCEVGELLSFSRDG